MREKKMPRQAQVRIACTHAWFTLAWHLLALVHDIFTEISAQAAAPTAAAPPVIQDPLSSAAGAPPALLSVDETPCADKVVA